MRHWPSTLSSDGVLADQARHHAGPAAVRVGVADLLERDGLVAAGVGQPVVVLPPLAELVVPTGVLLLEPLEVLVGHGVDAPVVDRPAGGEEPRHLVHVVLVDDALPRLLDEIVRDGQAVLLQRQQVAAVVVVIDPPPPHLGVALAVLAAVLGAVLDERADGRVDHAVVVPPRVAQVAFQQRPVALVGQGHQQDRIAVGDVPRLVGLHRVEHRRQQIVAVGRGLVGHRHEKGVGERGFGDHGQVDIGRGDRVTGDEPLAELAADGAGVVVGERLLGDVEPGGVDVVVHVELLEVHLDRRMTNLVDHLDGQPVVDLGVGHRVDGHRHGTRGRDLGERDDRQEQLLPFQPPLLHLAEHIAADGAVHGAEHAVVLLLLHREVGPHDLLERILLRSLLKGVVGAEPGGRRRERRFPRQLGDLRVSLGQALPTQSAPPGCEPARCRRADDALRMQPRDLTHVRLTMRRTSQSAFSRAAGGGYSQIETRVTATASSRAGQRFRTEVTATMVNDADDAVDLRRAREQFLTAGALNTDVVAAGVLDSWRRSQALHVHADRVELSYVRDPDTDTPLTQAAGPVLHRIASDLASQAVSVILTSADGLVLERIAPDSTIQRALDDVRLARGYSYAEEFAGTNGIGTTLETGKPTFIRGSEHFVGTLGQLACAGSPIRDPITRRLLGVVDLTCWASQSDPLLFVLAKSAGSQIEDRLSALKNESETALLAAYLKQCRRYPGGVLAVGGDVVLMNPYLRRTLDATDQQALMDHAAGTGRSEPVNTVSRQPA